MTRSIPADPLPTRSDPGGLSTVRALEPDELRGAHRLFATAIHLEPASDESWPTTERSYSPGRTLGIDAPDGALAGTATSFPTLMAVPGGAWLPMAAVTRVGVRADLTRRGLLTALMHRQLADSAAAGEVFASLRASEATIYGRFGYGVATRVRDVRLLRAATWRAGAPVTDGVRLVDHQDACALLPALYERIIRHAVRPGLLSRPAGWWAGTLDRAIAAGKPPRVAVHTGPDGDDGFVLWEVRPRHDTPDGLDAPVLVATDLHAADVRATAGLLRFLAGVDLVGAVDLGFRPLDEPVELLLADPRAGRTTAVHDEVWLRLVDVAAALAARAWGEAEPVRLRVRDALLPANDGVHLVGGTAGSEPGPIHPGPAELECDVSGLAMAYLGDRRPSELVATGWWTAHDPAAVARADRLFATPSAPWAGTFF